MNLDGWKTIITIIIWAGYEIAANVVPDFQRMDQATIGATVEAMSSLAMPLIMLAVRFRTTGPVAPPVAAAVQSVPVLNRMIKT